VGDEQSLRGFPRPAKCEGHKVINSLFEPDVPPGFLYRPDFITLEEESQLEAAIARIEFANFEMRGVIARRRVAFFGRSYDEPRRGPSGSATPPIPDFLIPLRAKAANWAGVEPAAFAMALINEYPERAPIGWHRDAPQYDIVAGVSLLSPCVMRFRPYVSPVAQRASGQRRTATHQVTLERRSGYLMTGEARNAYEHHVPAVTALRYSITFRTLRA
jgi:alkylated DNA repair dioxygenase AlkB